jgi:thiamine pyrophosphate-dependent acetolactate synthase large subunit-like protein
MFQMADMFKAFAPYRGNAVVIPGRGGRHWSNISEKPNRDVPLGDPAMGGHASFALGLALARPKETIILFDSEGDVLMNLGALATIAEKNPPNFYHFLLDNGVYATTGGQPVPNAQNVAYDVIAQGSGYPSTYSFDNLEDFTNNIEGILSRPGPVFVAMKVVAEIENVPIGQRVRWQKKTRDQTILDMQNDLGPRVV